MRFRATAETGSSAPASFADLWAGRELAWRLAVRDISAQYRQAFLGLLWAFILPLANTLTWIFLQGSGVVRLSETALPYAVYVFSGTMLWAIFMEALNAPLKQTESARSMLAKLNFPREALILTARDWLTGVPAAEPRSSIASPRPNRN